MANRTPPSQWGNLFNFAGGGLVHIELYPLLIVSALNPTLFEAIAQFLLPFGNIADRPAAADVPERSFYISNDEDKIYQVQEGAWIDVSASGGGGGGGDGCRLTNSADISVSNSTNTVLTFDTEIYDNGGMHANSPNPSRITIQTTGTYLLTAAVHFDDAGGGQLGALIFIKLNNTTPVAIQGSAFVEATQGAYISCATVLELTAGDYLEAVVYQDSGATTNVTEDPDFSPLFAAQQIQ